MRKIPFVLALILVLAFAPGCGRTVPELAALSGMGEAGTDGRPSGHKP